jgi:hypothetical protein
MKKIITIFLFWSCLASAQPAPPTSPPPARDFGMEIDTLKAELHTKRSINDQLLQVVTWSLGTTAATLIVILGYNWFQSRKIEHAERQKVKSELHTEILLELKEKQDKEIAALKEAFELRAKKIEEDLEERAKHLHYGILSTMFWDMFETGTEFINEEEFDSAFGPLTTALDFGLDMEERDNISTALDAIQIVASKAQNIPADLCAQLREQLARLPEEFGADRQAINDKLLKLRSK